MTNPCRNPSPPPHPFAGRAWRDLARFVGEALAAGLFASLVLALATFVVATQAGAAPGPRDDGAPSGLLLYRAPDATPVPAPLLATDVSISVSGIVARAQVRQRFHNPTAVWQEGVYVFPLPENAAVDHLEMQVGERRIEGQIRERAAARAAYLQAKAEGRKASLLDQERPNVFTTRVAHIGPGEDIDITIEYQQTLRFDAGSFRLRFPMVVAPRYIPGEAVAAAPGGTGWALATDQVPDAARITPPVAPPHEGRINPVTLTVDLDPGFALAKLDSPTHAIVVDERADGRQRVTLAAAAVAASRDFELAWTPDIGDTPGAALFLQARDGGAYALAMIAPPEPDHRSPRGPREVVFVVDTSGSMEGTSIAGAREALQAALDRLQAADRFNVIEFNSTARALFDAPRPADGAALARARAFVAGLRARGGTEMRAALELALPPGRAPGFVRQVVFLTDGAVGNEAALFTLIRERLGDRRLFTVGLGSAPNSHFMAKAAQFGRGSHTMIGDVREVAHKMGALLVKLESPVLTDIAIAWPGRAEAYPAGVPDLYAGEPIVVSAALDSLDGEVVVTGTLDGQRWQTRLPLAGDASAAGIGALWARAKIDALEDRLHEGHAEEGVRTAIVELALAHHLVSKYTSLVAVDVSPTLPDGAATASTALPVNLPDGMSFDAVFGGGPQTATPANERLLAGAALLLAAAALAALRRRRLRAERDRT